MQRLIEAPLDVLNRIDAETASRVQGSTQLETSDKAFAQRLQVRGMLPKPNQQSTVHLLTTTAKQQGEGRERSHLEIGRTAFPQLHLR